MSSTAVPTATRATWRIDPSHTTVEFVAKHMMITTVRRRFAEFEGTIVADEADLGASSVEVTFKAASIDLRAERPRASAARYLPPAWPRGVEISAH